MTTIYKIAEYAKVSPATVSRVLNGRGGVSEEKASRVEAAMRKTSFRPRWKAAPAKNIGFVVFPHPGCLSGAYSSAILSGAAETLFAEDYTVQLIPYRHSGGAIDGLDRLVTTHQLEGLMVLALHPTYEISKHISCGDIPHMTIGPVPAELGDRNIRADDFAAGYEAGGYLWSLRHRRLAVISASLRHVGHRQQLEGFNQAVIDRGGSADDVMHRQFASVQRSDGESAARELMVRADRPTAVFATNSELAHGFNAACRELNIRVPADVSLIGVEDAAELTNLDPPMTALCQPTRRIGELAALGLLAQLRGETPDPAKPLKMTLRVRQSTQIHDRSNVNEGRDSL